MNFDIGLDLENVEKLVQTSLDLDITVGTLINDIICQWFADAEDQVYGDIPNINKSLTKLFDGSCDPWDETKVDLDLYTKEEIKTLRSLLGDLLD